MGSKIIAGVICYAFLFMLTSYLVDNLFPKEPTTEITDVIKKRFKKIEDHLQGIKALTVKTSEEVKQPPINLSVIEGRLKLIQKQVENIGPVIDKKNRNLVIRGADTRFIVCPTQDNSSCFVAGKITAKGEFLWQKGKFIEVESFR